MSHEEIAESLKKEYLMLRKGRWWSFLGGAAMFVIATGFVSYQAALKAVEGSAAEKAVQAIEMLRDQAQNDRNAIDTLRAGSREALNEMNTRLDAMSTLAQSLAEIRSTIERGNPWEQFSDDIMKIVGDEADNFRYEYAVLRNGDFRTLTVSTWNGGWRVMTSPYMTGDSLNDEIQRFRLGGSMWFWGTDDERDDDGPYHMYYFADDGSIKPTGMGNERRTAAAQGLKGYFYRRPRK